MNRVLWWLRRRGAALALGGGVVLVLAALMLQEFAVKPMEQRIESLQRQPKAERDAPRDSVRDATRASLGDDLARPESPRQQLANFYAFFARDANLADRLERVYSIARTHGLELKRADYRLNHPAQRKLGRYQMTMPLHGSYPAIRAFVTEVQRDMPTLAVDRITFQRRQVGDGEVDAQISLTFFVIR